jgi:hypothetical protein
MKPLFTLFLLSFIGSATYAQELSSKRISSKLSGPHNKDKVVNFNGQWKGGFDETAYGYSGLGGNDIVYVLELNTEGSHVSGYSYTYFQEGNKKYYTICRLTGTLNEENKEVVVTEIERTKFNTPPNFQNCFQTHRLHYEKDSGDIEVLRGTWIPAPNQGMGCGSGSTVLSRRVVNRVPLEVTAINKPTTKPVNKKPVAHKPEAHKPQVHKPESNNLAIENHKPAELKRSHPESRPAEKPLPSRSEANFGEAPLSHNEIKSHSPVSSNSITASEFEPRRKDIVKTITIAQPVFRLDFYDNGEIDGDSITVFYNGKPVLMHQRLSDKPVTLTLSLDKNVRENIVTMYADNLGTIPPNTALMIVTDGDKRYEVRMESDMAKSGSVIFKHE